MMRFIFLYKIALTDRHPIITAICGSFVTLAIMAGAKWLGWL